MNLEEVWTGLRAEWLADTTLAGLLADDTSIYQQFPADNVPSPFLVLKIRQIGTPTDYSFLGIYYPSLQIDVYATERAKFSAIFARLEDAWSIPLNRADALTTDNYRVTRMRFMSPIEVGVVRTLQDNVQLRMWSIEAELRVTKRTEA